MLTFIAKARRISDGYQPVVMQRNDRGQMCGSAASPFTFATADAALAHAVACAERVSARMPFTRLARR